MRPIPRRDILAPRLYLVQGGSMAPAIPADSLVAVAPLQGSPRAGDVIAYRDPRGGRVIVHRVVSVGAGGALTRGDANACCDPLPVPEDAWLGRIVWASPILGRLALLLRGENAARRRDGGG